MKKLLNAVVNFMYSEVDLNPEHYKAYTDSFDFEPNTARRSA
jgi:hypothetical protein